MNMYRIALTLVLGVVVSAVASAQTSPAVTPAADQQPAVGEAQSLFGWSLPDTERLRISGTLIAGWSHDGAQAALGFEKQGRVGQATVALSGRIAERVRYFVSFNPVNEVPSKPACGEADFFFPNDPSLYVAGPLVPCDPERGHKRVDTYNTYALDYVTQQGPLREGYVDWRATDSVTARVGRFILPVGFAPLELGSWTAKDLTRIQRLNAEANFGLMLGYERRTSSGKTLLQAAAMGVLGEGNRQKDYDWFYFADTSLDTNSALTAVGSLRFLPIDNVDLRVAYKYGFTGSKVERLPSYWASKRNDQTFTAGARVQMHTMLSIFGEYARYVWGPTTTSAEMLGIDPEAIVKPGYYFGATFEAPIAAGLSAGVTVTREELSRDDSLVKYLTLNQLYGVEMGKKDRGTIARFYVDLSQLVTFGVFWADISNPYPWISASWPVSGPRAFTGRAPDRYGITVVVRTP
jgi:opacity protein-like surface antigen